MNVMYDVREIENSHGTGEKQLFALPLLQDSKSHKELSEKVSHSCSLTPADVEAALMAFGEVMREELASGHGVYLPEIGYFSIKVRMEMPDGHEKVRGNYIRVKNVNFKPEAALLKKLKNDVRFERAMKTMRSQRYTDEEMTAGVITYLENNRFITRRIMETEFYLRKSMAYFWLSRLVELCVLTKAGTKSAPVYYIK